MNIDPNFLEFSVFIREDVVRFHSNLLPLTADALGVIGMRKFFFKVSDELRLELCCAVNEDGYGFLILELGRRSIVISV